MTYKEYKETKKLISNSLDKFDKVLKGYPKDNNGLISDEIKNSELYKNDKRKFDLSFKDLQYTNKFGFENFKKEIQKDYKIKIMGLVNYNENTLINTFTGILYDCETLKVVGATP